MKQLNIKFHSLLKLDIKMKQYKNLLIINKQLFNN